MYVCIMCMYSYVYTIVSVSITTVQVSQHIEACDASHNKQCLKAEAIAMNLYSATQTLSDRKTASFLPIYYHRMASSSQ